MVYADGLENVDDYWNANWDGISNIDSNKWVIECKIPLNNLRYYNKNIQNWGVNFIRYIHNKNETIVWSVIPEKIDKVVSEYGHLINLELENSNSITIKPYIWFGEIEYDDHYFLSDEDGSGNPTLGPKFDNFKIDKRDKIGLDFKYNFNSSTILDVPSGEPSSTTRIE